jgi:ribosomal protein S18 acetylase RimI-like enzyme
MSSSETHPYRVRSFQADDVEACKRLYTEGLISASLAPNDTGWDIDNIDQVYMHKPENHFWVATTDAGEVVGMLGVQHHESGVGEIRRLRVSKDHRRRGIGSLLLETALKFCQQRGDVKITLDTVMDKGQAMSLFEKFHFRHHSSKQIGDKELLYFYADLYSGEKKQGESRR